MPLKVLVSAPYMQPVLPQLKPIFDKHKIELLVPPVRERLSEAELLGLVQDVEGVICGDDPFTEKVLRAASKLKVISKWGTGIDSIDQQAAQRLGIAVCNTPNAFTDPVADSVLGYVLCFARQLPWMDRDIKAGSWSKRPGVALRERALGIIGVGNIGQAVARRAHAFGMRVLGNDIVRPPEQFLRETAMELASKDVVLRQADFVSLNCDLNPTSYHIVAERELGLMKNSACLINTARGKLIDEPALLKALQEQRIAGAALDVFEQEPLPAESGLRSLDNCLLAPHNANQSPTAYQRIHQNTIDNLLRHLLTEGTASGA